MSDDTRAPTPPAEPVQVSPPTAAAAPSSSPERVTVPRAGAQQLGELDAAAIAELADGIDWQRLDMECPAAFCEMVGAEPIDPRIVVLCECGAKLRIALDGEHKARCPSCGTQFRHLLVVQAEDTEPSGCALAVSAILDTQRDMNADDPGYASPTRYGVVDPRRIRNE
jgi:hypothetical protein